MTMTVGLMMPQAIGLGEDDDLLVHFCILEEDMPSRGDTDTLQAVREKWSAYAKDLVDALDTHAPQGFVDALFGELALRKASVFYVERNG
jgi:hypothetical protein